MYFAWKSTKKIFGVSPKIAILVTPISPDWVGLNIIRHDYIVIKLLFGRYNFKCC